MHMELYKLFEENILLESRLKTVMAKYPDVDKEAIEELSTGDPSGNNKYLDWMVKEYVKTGGRVENVTDVVKRYHEKLDMANANNLKEFEEEHGEDVSNIELIVKKPKDINSFDLTDLKIFSDFLFTLVSKRKELDTVKGESDRIYEDKELLVVSPRTHRSSCLYGKHSAWCVATANTGHFANYTKNGTLYFFISKKDKPYNQYWKDKDNGQPPYKTALLLRDNGEISWWSKGDSNYTDGWVGDPLLPFLTPEIAQRVLAHNKMAIETRKQREIERVLTSPGFYKRSGGDNNLKGDFNAFVRSGVYSKDQLVQIVRNGNWLALYENSELGRNIRSTLGPNVVFSLMREIIMEPNSASDFTAYLKEINDQEFLTNYGKEFSDEQNREFANIILNKLKNLNVKMSASEIGAEVRMYIDKWTMTPEDWQKYQSTSNYFFIGRDLGDGRMSIENIHKGDRFNPKDHHAIKLMKLNAKMKGMNLYGVVTEKDLLDEYMGADVNEIPAEVVSMVSQKARQIK